MLQAELSEGLEKVFHGNGGMEKIVKETQEERP